MGALHHHVLHRVVGLLLGGDFEDDGVDLLSLGDGFSEESVADFLGHEDD